MLPRRGSICGRLTQDLPLGCLQGGGDRGAVAEAELAADGLDARGGVQAVWDPLPLPVRPHRFLRVKLVKFETGQI